jgi:glutathione S-transferase
MSRFISIAQARELGGLRMACLRGVPSPWTEAAKGVFYVKGLDCQYAAQKRDDEDDAIARWAGNSSVPVVAYENEPLRTGWAEILLLAERLQPEPRLIPAAAEERALLFGLAHEICGEMGLGWCLRLYMLKTSMGHTPGAGPGDGAGFPPAVTASLAAKYGFNPVDVAMAKDRVIAILTMLDVRLADADYLLGDTLSAVDIYWATFANLLTPLPEELLPAVAMIRDVYDNSDAEIDAALTPRLRAHQEMVYERHLELPVPL